MYQLIIMDAIFVLGQERIAGFMAGATIRLRDAGHKNQEMLPIVI